MLQNPHIQDLPSDILKHVLFPHLQSKFLFYSCRLVSQYWNQIILSMPLSIVGPGEQANFSNDYRVESFITCYENGSLKQLVGLNAFVEKTFFMKLPETIASNLTQLTELKIIGLDYFRNERVKTVPLFVNLKKLTIEKGRITKEGVKHISKMVTLTYLNLNNNHLEDAGCKIVRRLPNLKTLLISRNRITDKGVIEIA